MNRFSSQSGSAFLLILMGIAFFAALSYMVFQGGRSSEGNLSGDKARLAANDIIAYSNALATAVQKLRLAGCEDTQFDFTNSEWVNTDASFVHTAGQNPNAPATGCDVFGDDGKVKAVVFSSSYFVTDLTAGGTTGQGSSRISMNAFPGVGTSADRELVYFLPHLRDDVCMKINDILGVMNPGNAPPGYVEGTIPDYAGVYATGGGLTDSSGELTGKTAFCGKKSVGATNRFLKVLIVR